MGDNRKYQFHSEKSGIALSIRVIPGANASHIAEIRADGCVVVQLACGSSRESCNVALLKYLAEVLSVSESNMEIIAGESSDYKIISILELDSAHADAKLKSAFTKRILK